MLQVLRDGSPGTAMKSFANTLSEAEMVLVVDFIRHEFLEQKATNTRYHTAENGWPNHERYAEAFPFARGEIAIDTPQPQLTPAQRRGLGLYYSSCVSCHDRSAVLDAGPDWDARAVSFPRRHYDHRAPEEAGIDALSSATPYARHDIAPQLEGLTEQEREGERLFQDNCAFCHGADGSGRNWIGRFLQPHPRDLTDPQFMAGMTAQRLAQVIDKGLPGTGMPAWGGVLEERQVAALVAYIGRAFHPLRESVQ